MFRGANAVNMDAKSRIAMPTRYRACLKAGSILTIGTEERCLSLYPMAVWEEIEGKLAALPSLNEQVRRIQHLLIGHATEVELDAQGRMLVPPLLRDYAGLGKRAVLVGQGKKIELWAEMRWQERLSLWLKEEIRLEGELPDVMKLLSL